MVDPSQYPVQPTVHAVEMSNVTSQQPKTRTMSECKVYIELRNVLTPAPTIQSVESGLSEQEQEEAAARLRGGGCCGALCTCICAPFIAIGACLGAIVGRFCEEFYTSTLTSSCVAARVRPATMSPRLTQQAGMSCNILPRRTRNGYILIDYTNSDITRLLLYRSYVSTIGTSTSCIPIETTRRTMRYNAKTLAPNTSQHRELSRRCS